MRVSVIAVCAALAVGVATAAGQAPERRIDGGGVSVVVPETWPRLSFSNSRGIEDPVTRFVIASGPIRFGRGCNDIDYVIDPKTVAIVLVEWIRPTPGARWMARPARFTAKNLEVRPHQLECFAGPGGVVQFAQHGRHFGAFLLAGRQTTSAQVDHARAVLDTLRVKPRP